MSKTIAYNELQEYELIGLNQDSSFLEYTKTSMVHGNLEYGILYDNENDIEYEAKVDHKLQTITILNNPEKMSISIEGSEVLEKTVKPQGNGAMVGVPKSWTGMKVKVVLIEPINEHHYT